MYIYNRVYCNTHFRCFSSFSSYSHSSRFLTISTDLDVITVILFEQTNVKVNIDEVITSCISLPVMTVSSCIPQSRGITSAHTLLPEIVSIKSGVELSLGIAW